MKIKIPTVQIILLPIFGVLLTPFLFAQDELKSRVKQLELQVRELTEEVIRLRTAVRSQEKFTEQLAKPKSTDQATIYDDVIAAFREERHDDSLYQFYRRLIHAHLWLGGYLDVHIEGRESIPEEGILRLSSMAFRFRSTLHDNISIHGEIAVAKEDKVEVHHAYGMLSLTSAANLKLGVLPVPLGRYNPTSDPPAQALGSIPLLNQYLVPAIWSEPGIAVFGQYDAGLATLAYEIMASSGLGEDGFNTRVGNQDARQGIWGDNNDDVQWSGRVNLIPRLGLEVLAFEVGLSSVIGQYDDDANDEYRAFAWEWFFRLAPFTLLGDQDRLEISGEYVWFWAERDQAILQKYPDTAARMSGFYLQVYYKFFPEAWRNTWFLFTDESSFGIACRYDRIDLDGSKSGATRLDEQTSYTLGFHFRPITQTVLRVEYSWIRERVLQRWAWNNRVLVSFATYF